MEVPFLPNFDYHLDESDPDIMILRRLDGAFVAVFSARGATREGIVEAAKEDCGRLAEANVNLFGSLSRRRPNGERLTLEGPLFIRVRGR